MKVLVTGAAGFIGSHVANYLEAQGFDVIRSDIVSTPEFHGAWRQADLTKIEEVLGITSDIEAICHVGGIGDVYFAATEPRTTMNTNATGTLNMLEAARRAESIRFVYASTWEVYGPSKYEPVDEGHPCFPAHPYSISKLAGDLLVQAYGRNNSMESVVLRLGTAYGPRMRETAVIPAFILRAIRNEQIEVRGTGHQFRQFTHVSDIARSFHLALVAKSPDSVYNIVAPEMTTIRELAELVAARFPVEIAYTEPRSDDAPSVPITSRHAELRLGWKAEVPFRVGLDSLIDSVNPRPDDRESLRD